MKPGETAPPIARVAQLGCSFSSTTWDKTESVPVRHSRKTPSAGGGLYSAPRPAILPSRTALNGRNTTNLVLLTGDISTRRQLNPVRVDPLEA